MKKPTLARGLNDYLLVARAFFLGFLSTVDVYSVMDLIKLGKILAFLGEQTLGNEENGFFKVKKSRSSKGPAFFIKQM